MGLSPRQHPLLGGKVVVPVPSRSQFRAETRWRWTRSGHEKKSVSTGSVLISVAGISVIAVAGLPGEGQHGLLADASFTPSDTESDLASGGVPHNAPAWVGRLDCVLESRSEVSQMTPVCDPERPWLQLAFSAIPSNPVATTWLILRHPSATRPRTVVSPK